MRKIFLSALLLGLSLSTWAQFQIKNLRVEYAETPTNVDTQAPRFSWQMDANERGERQTAYQIVVKDTQGNTVWDTGKTQGGLSLGIHYAGKRLEPTHRYSWNVTVWDNKGKAATQQSWFETSLMSTSDKDAMWAGAKWIGGDDSNALAFYSQYLPVFRLKFSVQLDRKTRTTQAGFIYGANDIRLMDRNKNILGVSNGKDQSYIKLVLNTAALAKGDSASLDVYRIGYTKTDRADVPFKSFKLPTSLINKANQYDRHSFELSSMHGTTKVFLDKEEKPVVQLNLNPMGVGGDYISFPNVGDIGYSVGKGQKATFSGVEVLNYRLPRHTLSAVEGSITLSGEQRIFTPKETGAPMLRTAFNSDGKQVKKAELYVTARGTYEMYLNGQRIGQDFLNPGLTQYNKTQYYQAYDVTNKIHPGRNALGAMLNEGWWSGAISFSGDNWNFFGDKQSLLAKLEITYTDGTKQEVVTDPATWQFSNEGPILLGSIFQGEVYDARKERAFEGWATASYDASKWQQAKEVLLEGTISHEQLPGLFVWPCPDNYDSYKLTAQLGLPVRKYTELTAKSVEEVRPGVFVYDMGQNMAGIPHISFSGLPEGTRVIMRYAEVKYPNLPEYKDNVGMVMMENQRGAMEQDIYFAKGGNETFEPRATYHGYRYVEVTGIPAALPAEAVKGLVLSTVDKLSAKYETSSQDLNQFFRNTQWSTLANVFSIPTDCPQRNERMGWSGDLSVFSPTMSYLFDGSNFFRRHLQALRDTQQPDGTYPAVAPIGGGFGGALWSSVGIAMPWQSYLQYGDIDALKEHYGSMQQYIELERTKYIDPSDGHFQGAPGINLGDWLGFEVNKNDNSLIFDAYFTYELKIMANIARALGKTADAEGYEKLRQERIAFINQHYFDRQTGLTTGTGLGKEVRSPFGFMDGPKRKGVLIDTQTSYAVPLAFGIVDKSIQDKFIQNFANTITRQSTGDDGKTYPQYSLMTGFIGTAWISMALSEVGRTDLAYKMLLNKNFPSWLYPVEQGATTIWERLNSYTKENGFGGNNSMNSFNHYAFGSVTNWLLQRSLGIARDEASPAFKHFILRPEPDPTGTLTFARGSYDSMYGKIESSWQQTASATTYDFTIPANTSATVYLPAPSLKQITEGGKSVRSIKNITIKGLENGKVVMEVPSGKYSFSVSK